VFPAYVLLSSGQLRVELTFSISDVTEVIDKIQTVFAWTATGTTIPYSNFSDWLKFAPESS
jgi:hypothetical protein